MNMRQLVAVITLAFLCGGQCSPIKAAKDVVHNLEGLGVVCFSGYDCLLYPALPMRTTLISDDMPTSQVVDSQLFGKRSGYLFRSRRSNAGYLLRTRKTSPTSSGSDESVSEARNTRGSYLFRTRKSINNDHRNLRGGTYLFRTRKSTIEGHDTNDNDDDDADDADDNDEVSSWMSPLQQPHYHLQNDEDDLMDRTTRMSSKGYLFRTRKWDTVPNRGPRAGTYLFRT